MLDLVRFIDLRGKFHVLFQMSIFMPEMRFQLVSLDIYAMKWRLYIISESNFGSCFKTWICFRGLSFIFYWLQLIVRHVYHLLPHHHTPHIPFAFSHQGDFDLVDLFWSWFSPDRHMDERSSTFYYSNMDEKVCQSSLEICCCSYWVQGFIHSNKNHTNLDCLVKGCAIFKISSVII